MKDVSCLKKDCMKNLEDEHGSAGRTPKPIQHLDLLKKPSKKDMSP